jgi:LPS sulfotransferase NodH
MPSSRAIVVLGMHRSGTSVLTRGLQGLGISLGADFLGAQPDNPTGYWENNGIVDLNERLLRVLGLNWESISLIEDAQWRRSEVQALSTEAASYLQSHFLQYPLWGFKDPRTIRLLPFWRAVFEQAGVDDQYVVAIRTPLGVATSLLRRQNIAPARSHLLSLVYLLPTLHEIAGKPFVVTDYDLFVADPRAQLARIAGALKIPMDETNPAEIEQFSRDFLDPGLRHSYFSRHDFDTIPEISPLIREAYLWLHQLATDQLAPDAPEFWGRWKHLREGLEALLASDAVFIEHGISRAAEPANGSLQGTENEPASAKAAEASQRAECDFHCSNRFLFPGTGVNLFVVIGAQRTGTNLLREILNTNEQIAMLGEVLSPSSAPAHWENFLRGQPPETFPPASPAHAEALLDRYFHFVLYRIHNHWSGGDKSRCRAIGVDIKYNQLRQLAPADWSPAAPPFLLSYLKARGAILIHTTRRNVIHCALSAMIAAQRNLWHNYEGAIVDRRYFIDVQQCLKYARTIVSDRDAFLAGVQDCKVAECCYEDLAEEIGSADPAGEILEVPGPLRDIAKALAVPFRFRYDGRLRKAINVPYSQLLMNQEALSKALRESEFSAFAASFE